MSPPSQNESVICFDLNGEPVLLPRRALSFKPVVHGILLQNHAVLLERHRETGRYQPITAELDTGQGLELALQRRLRELLITPARIGPMLFAETQYITENKAHGWQLTRHYFLLNLTIAEHETPADLLQPDASLSWLNFNDLARADLQCGYDAIQLACTLGT